jgi:type IV secretion system protein VirB10
MAEQDNSTFSDSPEVTTGQDMPEVQNELSKVATNPKQSIAILVVISVVFIFIFYKLFFAGNKPAVVEEPIAPAVVSKPNQDNTQNLPDIPKLPVTPELEVPVQLPPPPPPVQPEKPVEKPMIPLPTPIDNSDRNPPPLISPSTPAQQSVVNDEAKKRREAKRKSSIVLIGGAPPRKTPEQIAEEASFQKRGDMNLVLAKGKVIEAVLETAINSDFKGEVRAIISRDIFAEQGKMILIPKGSKVFGVFSTSTAYGRVDIVWNRIDLSSGYTINLDGIGIDNLGRKGDQGRVDNKYRERLTNAVLSSALNIGIAAGLDKLVPPVTNSQTVAQSTTEANNILNTAQSIRNNGQDEIIRINQICSQVQNIITDKSSPAFSSIVQACNTALTTTGAQAEQRINALMTSVASASTLLSSNAAIASVPTQKQEASKQAFTDFSNTLKDMVAETQTAFKPTTTIDQGTIVKIYVNKDYKFPQAVFGKVRVIQ